jgi:hypothetical protein
MRHRLGRIHDRQAAYPAYPFQKAPSVKKGNAPVLTAAAAGRGQVEFIG